MPPPVSYVTITNPPLHIPGPGFVYQIQVAEFNAANERWFRYDTGSDPEAFGWVNGLATGYSPATNLYESDGTTLVNGNTGNNAMWWPLANNSTYYIRVRNQLGGGIVVPVNVLFQGAPIGLTTVPDGSWVINDDTTSGGNDGFPSAVYDPSGNFIGFISGIPAGETGDSLPDGTSLWHDRFGMYGGDLALFDNNFNFIDDFVVPGLIGFPTITNDGTFFYVTDRDSGDVYRVDPVAVTISASLGSMPFFSEISASGTTRDGTAMYWAEGYDSDSISKFIFAGSIPSTFYSIPGFNIGTDYIALTAVNNHPGEIIVLQDDTVATWWRDTTNGIGHILHLSSAGVLLHDIAFDEAVYGLLDHIHYSPNGAGSVHAWFFLDSGADYGRFGEVSFATGAFSQLFEGDLFSAGENLIGGSGSIFGPSASCTTVTFVYPGTETPPVDAEITVIKEVINGIDGDNEIEFQLVATGMDPINFTLSNGESILFSGLPNGTYGVVEVGQPGFITTYTVSNGDNNNSITVTAGDSVTVTVTNTRFTAGGIYKIQPFKRNDTLWTDIEANETIDVKIPNPVATGPFFGG